MKLTPFIIILIRDNYLEYRREKLKAFEQHVTPEMQSRINVLNSQMATRARIEPKLLTPENKMIVRHIKLQKAGQAYDNQVMARNALTGFLQSRKGESKAQSLKQELDILAGYIVALAAPHSVTWIPGPLKKVDKAMGKTIEDYDYAWGQNKDLVRGTLACRTNADLDAVAEVVKQTCGPDLGMFLIKRDHQQSVRAKGGQMGSGYSGWNFVVQFKDHAMFGAEVQANTFDLLYGKHSRAEVLEFMQVSPPEYAAFQARLRFPGGLGHALYDIQDIARSKCTKEEGDWARVLALDYNDACRGDFTHCTLEQLNARILQGASMLTTANAKALWHHGVEGSEWVHPIPH